MRELKTQRLFLRKPDLEDAGLLYREFGRDPELIRYTGLNPYFTPEATKEKVRRILPIMGKSAAAHGFFLLDCNPKRFA